MSQFENFYQDGIPNQRFTAAATQRWENQLNFEKKKQNKKFNVSSNLLGFEYKRRCVETHHARYPARLVIPWQIISS